MQVLRDISYNEQAESIQLTILRTITAFGGEMCGEKAGLQVILTLLGRVDDSNLCVKAIASRLLLGESFLPSYQRRRLQFYL